MEKEIYLANTVGTVNLSIDGCPELMHRRGKGQRC